MGRSASRIRFLKTLWLVVLAAGVLQGAAAAQERSVWSIDDNVSASYRLTDFHYVEPSDTCALAVCTNAPQTDYFDREYGFIDGFQASASGLLLRERLYARARYDWTSGYVRYQGYTQSGGAVPSTVSGAVISDYSVRLGAAFPEHSVMAVPFFEYGHHAWRRMVGVGTGQAYEEDYRHDYMALGVLVQMAFTDALVASIYASAGQTMNPAISVPAYDFSQALGTAALVKAGASLDFRVSRRLGVYGAVRYTRFSYGQSVAQPSGSLVIMEPQSNTVMTSYEGGMRFFF